TMRAHNIYPIARIVVVKDPLLADRKREWAIKRKSDGQPWLDKNGRPWLDAHQRAVWQYAADLGREAWDLGFSEVQLDYVRFPDERRLIRESIFPLAQGRSRAQVIRDQLGFTRGLLRAHGIPMTIDVFGLTATDSTDMGIGQKWEMFVDQADAVLPMNYPSHFAPGTYKISNPNARPYATIDAAMKDVRRRTAPVKGAGRIIPWYQDFTLGPPRYGVAEVRAQMEAGYDNGYFDWILWNPGSRYTLGALRPKSALEEGLRGLTADSARRAAAARRADSVRRADSARRSDSARAAPVQ
ncbi:MAG TPA: putative glycoside hydrolase, partial [Gemmatimonadaceae bacterium]|nr:putative glycoside hydrolase [Gemmatimonadaceae bacterium]